MTTQDLLDQLSLRHPKGYDLSLERIGRLMAALGDPQHRLPPVFHVAGTNGKGSVVAFLRAMLAEAGHTAHVHTSPHLVTVHERFRLGGPDGGRLVDDAVLKDALQRAVEANDDAPITLFELLAAAMFVMFREHAAEYCVIEVGLGGRLDATNLIERPAAAIITPIALDHQGFLGETIAEIAGEKAGIIKPGVPVIIGPQEGDALDVLVARAAAVGSPTMIAGQDFDFYEQEGRLVYQDGTGLLDLSLPRLRGHHQLANAAVAIAALRSAGPAISDDTVDKAMSKVEWPGRMERLKPGRLTAALPPGTDVWIDGGHNPAAARAVAAELANIEDRDPRPVWLVCAMLRTKDAASTLSAFEGLVGRVVCVPVVSSDAGYAPEDLARIAGDVGLNATSAASLGQAMEQVAGDINAGDRPARVLISGTLYLIGQALAENGTQPQ